MLAILSPARNLRPQPMPGFTTTKPLFARQANRLIEALRGYSPWELESLLDVNPQKALELYDLYLRFSLTAKGTPALTSYFGPAFRNMGVAEFDRDDFAHANAHIRIMSALYGVLRPRDGIQPYRLGVNKDFRIEGQTLCEFWGDALYKELFSAGQPVLSLTSGDYAKLLKPYISAGDTFITCRFLIRGPGGALKATVNSVRTARGQMARFLVKERVTTLDGAKYFDWEGYAFHPGYSDHRTFVFVQEKHCLG